MRQDQPVELAVPVVLALRVLPELMVELAVPVELEE